MKQEAIRVAEAPAVAPARGVPARALLLALFALFALDEALLPVFLGHGGLAMVAGAVGCGLIVLLARAERSSARTVVGWSTIGWCGVVATLLLLLGGEGRLFYATPDWQVRDAVLRDLARHPWPFAYLDAAGAHLLRAPLGMYLLPALFGRGGQGAADAALLACNAATLTMLLALASSLFDGARARALALVAFVSFSGLDIVGTLIVRAAGRPAALDHLEEWMPALQYSSVATLVFWVPQHAMAGWFCALAYLMHRRGLASIGSVAAAVPAAAFWSPLAVIGALPFVAWAGLRALTARAVRPVDVAAAAAATALAAPAVLYLLSDTARALSGVHVPDPVLLVIFLVVEIGPALWIVVRMGGTCRFGGDGVALATASLLVLPFFRIGDADFVMRASIPALAILAAALASALERRDRPASPGVAAIAAVLIAGGTVTGVAETANAIRLAPAPPPRCSLPDAWVRQSGWIFDISTYVARIDAIPAALRPADPAPVATGTDRTCWSRPWKTPR